MFNIIAFVLLNTLISRVTSQQCDIEHSLRNINSILKNSESYDIVYPKYGKVTSRKKRGIEERHEIILNDWVFELEENDGVLFKNGLQSEWVDKNGETTKSDVFDEDLCKLHRGRIMNSTSSLVALTICDDEMMGFINSESGFYFIQPLQGGSTANTHLLFKTTRLRGDLHDDEGFEDDGNLSAPRVKRESYLKFDTTEKRAEAGDVKWSKMNEEGRNLSQDWIHIAGGGGKEEEEEVGYFLDNVWEKEPIISRTTLGVSAPHRWLEIALAVDHSVIAFHGKDRVQQYVLALMNIVSAIYKDPSLASNLKLVIVRMTFYEDKASGEVREGNSKRSLENVNRWNERVLRALPRTERHDVAIWLTRLDLGGPSGYAPVAGACDVTRSCTLNRDEGLTSSFIIAHELAHVLGLTHDGDEDAGNGCALEAALGSVMAPMVAATFHRFSWSSCSRREFHNKTTSWSCLSNPPKSNNVTHLRSTLQATFTMDEQCRMEFGEGFSLCRSFELPEPCTHLWCGHFETPLVCKTKKGPPLEGTECGVDKWCVNGYCEMVDRQRFGLDPVVHNPLDGGWTSWGGWGVCSRSCGGGVAFRARRCDNPRPAYGGKECSGRSEEFRICNYFGCPEPRGDFRAEQCARLPSLAPLMGPLGHRANLTWLAHEPDQGNLKCQLTCLSRETGEVFLTGENLEDGTRCSYDHADDMCIQGDCQEVGCDGVLDSGKGRDACGVCGGDNTQCHNITSVFVKVLKRASTRVVVLPRSSRNILIEANISSVSVPRASSSVQLTLRDRRHRRYALVSPEDRNAPRSRQFRAKGDVARARVVVEGARFHYERRGLRETLRAQGPLTAELIVSVSVEDLDAVNVSITSSYTVGVSARTERYRWQLGGWGPCSKSCGTGVRSKTLACRDSHSSRIVAKRHCSLMVKPPGQTDECNEYGCDVTWRPRDWEFCSATCGSRGVQHREVFCYVNGTAPSNFVDPVFCADEEKPDEMRACNRFPCAVHWTPGNWSQCSTSCGRGFETREPRCPMPRAEPLFTCGTPPRAERRVCRHRCAARDCRRDASKYCRLTDLLGRFCVVPGFRRLCCKSCQLVSNNHVLAI